MPDTNHDAAAPVLHEGWNFLECGCRLHIAGGMPTGAPDPECDEAARLGAILDDLMRIDAPTQTGDLTARRRAAWVERHRHYGCTDLAMQGRWPEPRT